MSNPPDAASTPPAQPPYGQVPPAQQPQPQLPYGQVPPGHQQYAPPPYGQVPPGQQQYAPPPYGQVPPAPQPPMFGAAPPVPIGESYRFAWAAFKLDPVPWVVAVLVLLVTGAIGQGIVNSMRRTTEWMDMTFTITTPGAWFVNLLFTIIGYVITAALLQAALRAADGRRTTFSEFTSIPNLGQAALAAVILAVATSIGYFLLIIPGLVVQVLGTWYLHLALDRGLSAVDALKGSVQLVSRNLGTTVLFGLSAIGVMILGAMALGVGLFVAVPLVLLASVFVFRRLTGGPVMVPGSASR